MKLKKRIALALATCMIAISLSACSGKETPSESENGMSSESGKSNSPAPETISEAFAQEGIWFYTNKDEPTKDTRIKSVYVFDGKGNVTVYGLSSESLCFADLRDLSDKEILELVKEKNKTWFEESKQSAIEYVDKEIAKTNEMGAEVANRIGMGEEWLNKMKTIRTNWEQLEYEQTTYSQPFTLEVETDGTGNQTANETLCYTRSPADVVHSEVFGNADIEKDSPHKEAGKVLLHSTSSAFVVYDKTFMGCGNLYQRRNEGEYGWVLDSPDTKGIKVVD